MPSNKTQTEVEGVKVCPGVSFWSWPRLIVLGVFVLDEWTKWLVITHLQLGESWTVIPQVLDFTYVRNTGASWGIFSSHTWLLGAISAIAFLALLVMFRKLSQAGVFTAVCLALLEGGIAGNMLDRICRGYVVDFLNFHWWPVFNVADSAICVSVALLVVQSLWQDIQAKRRK